MACLPRALNESDFQADVHEVLCHLHAYKAATNDHSTLGAVSGNPRLDLLTGIDENKRRRRRYVVVADGALA